MEGQILDEQLLHSWQQVIMIKLLLMNMVCVYVPHNGIRAVWASYSIACFNLGLMRQPQWGHLTELHGAIKSCSKALLYGTPVDTSLGPLQQVRTSSVIMQFNSMLGVAIGFLKSSSALTYSGHCLQRITRNMCSISDKQWHKKYKNPLSKYSICIASKVN